MGRVVLRDVAKLYNSTTACTGINLEIEEGEFFTFLGPSGCGKTTILRLIAGFIKPDRGTIHLGEQDITRLAPEDRNVGMVFQNFALFPFLTVGENIDYGLKVKKLSRSRIRVTRDRMLALVGLEGHGDRKIDELSGGEQQRVALARSLAVEPRVLLLDEPLSNLDARLRDSMRAELKRMQQQLGITTIFVTHDQTEAMTMSDRIAVFHKGRCLQVGQPADIYNAPANSFVAGFVGETNLFHVHLTDGRYILPNNQVLGSDLPSGGRFVSIRPQHIHMDVKAGYENCLFSGIIKEIVYNGLFSDYVVDVQGLLFKVTRFNDSGRAVSFALHQRVQLSFSSADISILEQ